MLKKKKATTEFTIVTKQCYACKKAKPPRPPKAIHFYTPGEWARTDEEGRLCQSCMKIQGAKDRAKKWTGHNPPGYLRFDEFTINSEREKFVEREPENV